MRRHAIVWSGLRSSLLTMLLRKSQPLISASLISHIITPNKNKKTKKLKNKKHRSLTPHHITKNKIKLKFTSSLVHENVSDPFLLSITTTHPSNTFVYRSYFSLSLSLSFFLSLRSSPPPPSLHRLPTVSPLLPSLDLQLRVECLAYLC